jgi:large subunit ribosomal protein L25
MANFEAIEASARLRAGKGVARATRREGKVPGVIYGAKQEPSLIALDPRIVWKELKRGGWRSRIYEIDVDGNKTRALFRDVQFHPVTDQPEHVDFQRLVAGEPVRVAVVVNFINEATSPGLKRGGVLNVVLHKVDVIVDPEHIPEHFTIDLAKLDINDTVHWSTLPGTENLKPAVTGKDFVVVTIAPPLVSAEQLAAEAAAAAAAAAAKGGKGKGAPKKK